MMLGKQNKAKQRIWSLSGQKKRRNFVLRHKLLFFVRKLSFYGLSSKYMALYCHAEASHDTSFAMSLCTISSQCQRSVK